MNNLTAATGKDKQVWYRMFDGKTWAEWKSAGGQIAGAQPVVGVIGTKNFIFCQGTDNALWYKIYDSSNNTWINWTSLGGTIVNLIDAQLINNLLYVFIEGGKNIIFYITYDNITDKWSNYQSLGAASPWITIPVTTWTGKLNCTPCTIVHPSINIVNNTEYTINIPFPPNVSTCCFDWCGGWPNPRIMNGLKFNGKWLTLNQINPNAPRGDGLGIFTETDVVNWNKQEYGFFQDVKDGIIYAFLQGPGNQTVWWRQQAIDSNPDGLEHEYRCEVQNDSHTVIYYIDNILKASFTNPTANYSNLNNYFVIAENRTVCDYDTGSIGWTIRDTSYVS